MRDTDINPRWITDDFLEGDPLFESIIDAVDVYFRAVDKEIKVKIVYLVYGWMEENHSYRFFTHNQRKNLKRKWERRYKKNNDLGTLADVESLCKSPNLTRLRKNLRALWDKETVDGFIRDFIKPTTDAPFLSHL
jgi:hypothetical protein